MGKIAGVVLYLTYPYRVFVCINQMNLRENVVWMLLPLYGWAIVGLLRRKSPAVRNQIVAVVTLAGIGYADCRMFLITMGMAFLMTVCWRMLQPVACALCSCVLFAPGLYRLAKYLFTDAYLELGISLQSIMPKGYRVGQFLGTYAFREEHPGIGLGMLLSLAMGLWLVWVQGEREKDPAKRRGNIFVPVLAVCFLFFSTRYCPWDFVQRVGSPFLRLIGIFATPAVFFGYACALLCIPAAVSVTKLESQESRFLSFSVPLSVIVFCIGTCLYQCGGNIL